MDEQDEIVQSTPQPPPPPIISNLARCVLASRLMLLPLTGALMLALLVVIVLSFQDVAKMFQMLFSAEASDMTLPIYSLFEKFMIAVVLITTILGSFHIYIHSLVPANGWLPPWLSHLNANYLKIATCLSLAGVTSIGLLEDYHRGVSAQQLAVHIAVHFSFIFSAMAIALIDLWMYRRSASV